MDADYTVEGGDVYGRWEQGIFQFSDLGERDAEPVLQVHGTWELVLPEDAYPQAALFCNEWNAVNAWPKAYAQIEEVEHVVGIFGETTVDLTAAPTAEQVELVVSQGIGTALLLFDAAAEAFPDARAIE
ncbi:putative sensory transduction regulator [Haloactinopolyspora alba]|uniref:Putative sensory transduction regulator n=2 Tax=Haloactinopolyspora alba TaxID=648780 RepID=A0A2P8DVV7_9ACTN|nr:putative sensory transduction regulator [Haloactinopolyspora alba]